MLKKPSRKGEERRGEPLITRKGAAEEDKVDERKRGFNAKKGLAYSLSTYIEFVLERICTL